MNYLKSKQQQQLGKKEKNRKKRKQIEYKRRCPKLSYIFDESERECVPKGLTTHEA